MSDKMGAPPFIVRTRRRHNMSNHRATRALDQVRCPRRSSENAECTELTAPHLNPVVLWCRSLPLLPVPHCVDVALLSTKHRTSAFRRSNQPRIFHAGQRYVHTAGTCAEENQKIYTYHPTHLRRRVWEKCINGRGAEDEPHVILAALTCGHHAIWPLHLSQATPDCGCVEAA